MTPLAQRYFGQLMMKKSDRAHDPFGILRPYTDLHCFEVSTIFGAISDSLVGQGIMETVEALPGPFFLPAPSTWLEWQDQDQRIAFLIDEYEEGGWLISRISSKLLSAIPCVYAHPPHGIREGWDFHVSERPVSVDHTAKLTAMANAIFMVDVINTPSLIRLVEHEPHRGFARRFRNSVGGYPLHGWHEVTIDPAQIREVSDASGLSGRKCLHFVRKHRRCLQDGRMTLVSAHWRGDPAIGMMRTRYTVASVRGIHKGLLQSGSK